MTNCKNCGAPLHGGKCEYCGTEYETATMYYEPLPPPRRVGVFLKDREALARHARDEWVYGEVEYPPKIELTTAFRDDAAAHFLLATYPPFPSPQQQDTNTTPNLGDVKF